MFPEDIDLESVEVITTDTVENTSPEPIRASLKFDYETERFVLVDGKNVEPSKIDTIKQWIELYLRTELGNYKIYTDEFGVDLRGLVGYRLPRGYQVSEIMRRINEGILAKCPNVVSITDWQFSGDTFSFTVTTDTGEEVVISE